MSKATLTPVIMQLGRIAGQSVPRERQGEIEYALARASQTDSAAVLVQTAWKAAKLDGEPTILVAPSPSDCPFIGWQVTRGWFVVASRYADGSWLAVDTDGASARIRSLE